MIQFCNKGNLHLYCRYLPFPSKPLMGLYTHFSGHTNSLQSKLFMDWAGFGSQAIYTKATHPSLIPGWWTFLTCFGSYNSPTPAHSCVLGRHHQLIAFSLLLSADVTSEFFHLHSYRHAHTFTIDLRMSKIMSVRCLLTSLDDFSLYTQFLLLTSGIQWLNTVHLFC